MCILPFVMLCLSAWRIMFVKMVFAVCILLVVEYNIFLDCLVAYVTSPCDYSV